MTTLTVPLSSEQSRCLELLRQHAQKPDCPVLLMTGDADEPRITLERAFWPNEYEHIVILMPDPLYVTTQ